MTRKWRIGALIGVVAAAGIVGGIAGASMDVGQQRDASLAGNSEWLFGVRRPLPSSSANAVTKAVADANPLSLVTLAPGLKVRIVTAGQAAPNLDMFALWPNDTNPEWLVVCNEQGAKDAAGAPIPGLQRVNVATGKTETIVFGTVACDGVRRTAWGTVLFSEEAGGYSADPAAPNVGGRAYEVIDPLGTTNVNLDRATGKTSGGTNPLNVVVRPALGRLSFEGFALYDNGLVYYGDENRPAKGVAGGAYFKFVPTKPFAGGAAIKSLADSPFASGKVSGLRVGARSGNTDYGQGTETGQGTWVAIPASHNIDAPNATDPDLRKSAADLKLTGYYRPEDGDVDLSALAVGKVRWCYNNTGNEDTNAFGNTICVTDGTLADAMANKAVPEVQLFHVGNPQLAMVDNLAIQPKSGNVILHEDAAADYKGTGLGVHNNDLWSCLPDGADDDTLSDGCVRIATLNDPENVATAHEGAEWTGGIFDSTGTRFFVSVQHNITGKGLIIEITGWSNVRSRPRLGAEAEEG